MIKRIFIFLGSNFILASNFGVKDLVLDDATLKLSPYVSSRPGWIKGANNNLSYVNEIQVHLDKEINTEQSVTSHFTVLRNGELLQHAFLDQIAHFSPQENKKMRLQDQYLIHINVAGREPNLKQIDTTHKLINDIRKLIPNISTKWCVIEPYLLTIPWLKEPNVFQYSDNLYLYKLFTFTNQTSDVNTLNNVPIYSVPSINNISRDDNLPKTLNIFRTGKSGEETCISYLNKNKKNSSHFTIDENGRIYQHVPLEKTSYFATPCTGLFQVGRNISLNQVTIGLCGMLDYPITLTQRESLSDLVSSLRKKYDIKNWTTPCKATKNSIQLEANLIPSIEKLEGVSLTKDPKLANAQSLIYDYPSPNQSKRPEGKIIDTIVLHHTHSSWPATLIGFSMKDGISAHFTINQDGMIVQHVPIEMKAWHAGVSKDKRGLENVNEFSIGIEIVNTGDCKDPYTDEQINSLKSLLNDLKNILEKNFYQITTHEYVAQPKGRKNDPLGFPWDKLSDFNEYIVRNTDEQILNTEFSN